MTWDRRWRNVKASIGPCEITDRDREGDVVKLLENLTEFRIQVRYLHTTFVCIIRYHDDNLGLYAEERWASYKMILDEMVESLDEEMEKYASNPPPSPAESRPRPW